MTNLTFISHHIDSCHPRNNQGLWVILLKKNSRKTLERGPTYEETFLFNLDEDMTCFALPLATLSIYI